MIALTIIFSYSIGEYFTLKLHLLFSRGVLHPLLAIKFYLAQSDAHGRYLYQLVLGNEFEALLER